MKDVHDSLLVGVFVDGGCLLNPPSDTRDPAHAELLVVRDRPIVAHVIPTTGSPITWRSSPAVSNRAPRAQHASQ